MIRTASLLALVLLALSAVAARGQDDLAEAARLMTAGRYADAALVYERLQRANPDDYEATMGFGRALFMQHENNRSMALFERAERLQPERGEPWFWRGRVLERSGLAALERESLMARPTLSDAVVAYRRAIALDPRLLEARLQVVGLLILLERWDEALQEVRAALAVAPGNEELLVHELGILYRGGRLGEFLDACARLEGKLPLDLIRMLDASARLGRVAETETLFLRAFAEGYSGRLEPYAVLATAWALEPRLADQIRILETRIEQEPEDVVALFYLGYALGQSGRLDEARRAFERYLEQVPGNVATVGHLVRIARLQGRFDDARSLAGTLIELAPDDPAARIDVANVVLALVEARRFPEALSLHGRLHEVAPGDADVARNQAILLKENGRLEEALAIIDQLIREAPVPTSQLASFINDKALCLKGLGRIDEAIAAFREAAATWERHADARENLGILLIELGRAEEARRELEASIAARRASGETDPAAYWRARYHLGSLRSRPR